jgi:hypothetical protein
MTSGVELFWALNQRASFAVGETKPGAAFASLNVIDS